MHSFHGSCGNHPKLLNEYLHYIQYTYNFSNHSSTQVSPFEACLGYLSKYLLDFIFGKDIAVNGHSDVEKSISLKKCS